MTQAELAEAMGVSTSTVTGWENGKSSPHFQVLLQLRDFFQIDLTALVDRDLQKERMEGNKRASAGAGDTQRLEELIAHLSGRLDALEGRIRKVEEIKS